MAAAKFKRRIKREMGAEKPSIWIGKGGATAQIMDEVSRQLDQREMVKIRALKSALKDDEAKAVAEKIAQGTEATLIDVRGHTFVLYKRRKKRKELKKPL